MSLSKKYAKLRTRRLSSAAQTENKSEQVSGNSLSQKYAKLRASRPDQREIPVYNTKAYEKANEERKRQNVDDAFVNTFLTDANHFLSSAEGEYSGLNYRNAASTYGTKKSSYNDLRARSEKIRGWLEGNKHNLSEDTYSSLVQALDSYDTDAASVISQFRIAADKFGQFKTEDDYNQHIAEQKDYMDLLNFDQVAGQKEIEDLTAQYEDYYLTQEQRAAAQVGEFGYDLAGLNAKYDQYERQYGSPEQMKAMILNKERYLQQAKDAQYLNSPNGYNAETDWEAGQAGWDAYQAEMEENNQAEDKPLWKILLEANAQNFGNSAPDTSFQAQAFNNAKQAHKDVAATKVKPRDDWSKEQQNRYGYLYQQDKQNGTAMADVYAKALNNALDAQSDQQKQEAIAQSATSNGGKGALHTLGALAADVLFGLPEYMDKLAEYSATGEISTTGFTPSDYSQAVTGGINQSLNEWSGTIDEDAFMFGGKGVGDIYSLGYSGARSMLTALTMGETGTLVSFMGSAGAAGIDDAMSRGASPEQALIYGTIVGAAEGVTEAISADNLLKLSGSSWKQFLTNTLNQALGETVEEGTSSIIEKFADGIVMADKSKYNMAVQQYVADGMDIQEARNKAFVELVGEVAYDAFGGFVTGGGNAMIVGSATRTDAKQNYEESKVNQGILQLIDRVKQGNYSGNDKVYLNNISEVAASRIQELTGIDTRGYKVAIEARQIEHILKDHGENGITDRSMANSTDIAKMEYVLENPDAINKAGTTRAYVTNKNGKMKPADTVLYEKQNGDGSYYVVQAVPDTKKKTLYVVTAFIGKSGYKNMEAPQSTNAKDPGVTPKAESAVASNNSIPQTAPGVNNETVLQSTGEAVNFEKFTKVENGKATVLANGKEVDAADVSLGDEGTDLVFHSVIGFDNMTASGANAIMQAYKTGGVSAGAFGQGAAVAYRWGYHGFSETELAKQKYAGKLKEVQRDVIYQAGKEASIAAAEADQNRVDSTYAEAQEILDQTGKESSTAHRAILDDGITLDSLSESQRVSYELADKVAQAAKVGVRVYIGDPGEFGYYDHDSDTVCLNLNAKNKSRVSMMAFTLGHELVHRSKQGSPKKYKAFADFLAQEYGKQGVSMEELIAEQIAAAKRHNIEMSEDKAFEEVVCDACQRMLLDTNAGQKLAEFGAQSEQNKGILKELKRWISQFMDRLRKVFKGVDPDSMAAKEFAKFDISVQQTLADMFVDMTIDAGEKLSVIKETGLLNKNTATDSGKQYKFGVMTQADIQVVQNIGRKSVNAFTSADIKVTERFAQQYWKEMGVKSPFFRAWFGDWRANDQTRVQVANQRVNSRGVQKNVDTGWNIQVSGKVFNETKVHTDSYNIAARPYLPFINDIVQKAILLDSFGVDPNKPKSNNSLLMHSLYAVADIGNGLEVLKLYVEEMNDPNASSTTKRAYQLQNVEKYQPTGKSSQKTASSISPVATGTIRTVADLFAAVKRMDKDFQPNPVSGIVDANGKPKQVYHGSSEIFNTFSYGHIGNATGTGILGNGFYFTDREKLAKGHGDNLYASYLQMRNPYRAKESDAYTLSAAKLQKQGYDGAILSAPSGDIYMVINNTQIKSATDNIGTFDGNNPDIRYKLSTGEDTSPRALLATALESVAQNEAENYWIKQYREKISQLNEQEQKLHEQRAQIRELSFAKGKRDTAKIKELQLEAVKTENRINILDKQLLRIEAAKPLRGLLESEKAKAKKRAEQKAKRDLEAYRKAERERSEKREKEIREGYQESRKKAMESRHRTEMRHKIQKVVKKLNDLLLKETKDKHVPENLKNAVAEALDAVNMDTVGAEERLAKYDALIAEATDPDVIAALEDTRERIANAGDRLSERMAKLKAAYDSIKSGAETESASIYDEVIAEKIQETLELVGDTALRDMNMQQLEAVYEMYTMVSKSISNANKAFKLARAEGIRELGAAVGNEITAAGGSHPYSVKALEGVKRFDWNNQKPVYAFERMGSKTLSELYENVRAGEDTWARDVTEAKAFYQEQAEKYGYDQWDMKKQYTFASTTGHQFTLSLEQIMSLYAYAKREQAGEHLFKGGFVFDSAIEVVQKKHGIPVKYKVNTASAYNLSGEILADIIGTLTEVQAGFVDAMQEYLSAVMGEKGNEVSMALYDVKLFKEKNYFPLRTAKQYIQQKNEAVGELRLKNSGFSKKTVPHANNPVILGNFMDVWAGHVNDMSMYHAFVLPLEDFNRVYNYSEAAGLENADTESVKARIQNAYGKQANDYIEQLLKDLNGGARQDPRETATKKLVSNFKKAAVMGSLSVIVQQPTALVRAMAVVDGRYFGIMPITHGLIRTVNAKKHRQLWSEVKQYAPVAVIKEMGHFDTNMGRSTQDFIKAKEYKGLETVKGILSDSGYRDEVISRPAALADEMAWVAIWEAVKKETADKHKDLQTGSEAFLRAVGRRFTEVVTKTQVYDSVLSRSANMRAKSGMMDMLTSFMAEPTTSINMLQDALLKAKRGDKKGASRAIGAVYGSVILNAALVSFVYAMRDDDEDETFLEKYLSRTIVEVLDGMNPLTYIPFMKDVWSIMQGFDVERADMSLIADLVDAMRKAVTVISKDTSDMEEDELEEHRKQISESLWNIGDSIASLTGLPVKNIRRDINGVINLLQTMSEDSKGRKTTANSLVDAIQAEAQAATPIVGWLPGEKKKDKLYGAIISGDTNYVERIKNTYASESSYETAVRSIAKNRFATGDLSADEALEMLTEHGGFSKTEAAEKVAYWNFQESYTEYADWSQSAVTKYYDHAKPAGIDLKDYNTYLSQIEDLSKKDDLLKVINGLPLTVKQKDALYYLNGWAESKLSEAPWH